MFFQSLTTTPVESVQKQTNIFMRYTCLVALGVLLSNGPFANIAKQMVFPTIE